jgi:hypothetical protein
MKNLGNQKNQTRTGKRPQCAARGVQQPMRAQTRLPCDDEDKKAR